MGWVRDAADPARSRSAPAGWAAIVAVERVKVDPVVKVRTIALDRARVCLTISGCAGPRQIDGIQRPWPRCPGTAGGCSAARHVTAGDVPRVVSRSRSPNIGATASGDLSPGRPRSAHPGRESRRQGQHRVARLEHPAGPLVRRSPVVGSRAARRRGWRRAAGLAYAPGNLTSDQVTSDAMCTAPGGAAAKHRRTRAYWTARSPRCHSEARRRDEGPGRRLSSRARKQEKFSQICSNTSAEYSRQVHSVHRAGHVRTEQAW